ncbi:MAG: transglutaminase-like domain-containing protein [Bacteroidota bacterium]|nr:transglutaminase-like domain-containing protein [Bacteroidota bacterium]
MKKQLLFFCTSILAASTFGQQVIYNAAAVPEALKKGASVIVHDEAINLEVSDLDDARLKVRKLFTVLNEDGKSSLFFNEYSTKFLVLDDAEIKVYDQQGKVVQKHRKKEMMTSAVGEGLIEEGYVTFFQVKPSSYPVTVEFNYEQKLKSTFYFPDYRFIHKGEAIVQSSYTAKVPADLKLRFKARYCSLVPVITEGDKQTTYQWSVKAHPALEDEEGSRSMRDRFPYVNIVADRFSHYGFRGDMSSWKSFGSWINELYTNLDVLPAQRQQFFQQLVSDAQNEKEKVRRIYHFLQNNFRYVSIQLGIGGLRPFSAEFTDQKKYGDCKALSNYMKAALKTVGIRSHVAIINAGYNEEPVDASFPASNFNHVVLCVPGKDSIWLECTSNTADFNRLGTFTENRNALLITEEGGVLVTTPRSDPAANTIITHSVVKFESDLSATTQTSMQTSGEYTEMMNDIMKEARDEQKKTLVFYLGYKQPDEFEFTAADDKGSHQTSLKMAVRKLHEFNAGTKYFFNPRIHKLWPGKLPAGENRKLDYYFRYPFSKKDTTVLQFPEGYVPEVLPAEKRLETEYATYTAKTWFNEKEKAFYTATALVLKKHKVAAGDYARVKTFFDAVAADEAQKLVVKKTEAAATAEKKAF